MKHFHFIPASTKEEFNAALISFYKWKEENSALVNDIKFSTTKSNFIDKDVAFYSALILYHFEFTGAIPDPQPYNS